MTEHTITGAAWRFGSDIDTDVIVPSQYMRFEPEKYAKYVMEPVAPDFASNLNEGDIIVAERNFGIGSSREHAAIGLKRAGIGAIIAESFGRIFYRNAINQGLPILEADTDMVAAIDQGDELTLNPFEGRIKNETRADEYQITPPSGIVHDILSAGGAKSYYRD